MIPILRIFLTGLLILVSFYNLHPHEPETPPNELTACSNPIWGKICIMPTFDPVVYHAHRFSLKEGGYEDALFAGRDYCKLGVAFDFITNVEKWDLTLVPRLFTGVYHIPQQTEGRSGKEVTFLVATMLMAETALVYKVSDEIVSYDLSLGFIFGSMRTQGKAEFKSHTSDDYSYKTIDYQADTIRNELYGYAFTMEYRTGPNWSGYIKYYNFSSEDDIYQHQTAVFVYGGIYRY